MNPLTAYKDIQLPQLRSFCLVAMHENFAESAKALGLSRPTVWQQVRALERELGAVLLRRHGRGVKLTLEGRLLLELVQPHVSGLDSLGQLFATRRAEQPQQVTVASTHYLLSYHLPAAVRAFVATESRARLQVRASLWPEVMLCLCLIGCASSNTPTAQCRRDIADLHMALAVFNQHFNVPPPSRIRLASKATDLDPESAAYLRRMFPNQGFWDTLNAKGIVWNDRATGPVTLEGDQCLVFFLGGPQRGGVPQGWSQDPNDPTAPGGTRIFYEFPRERLRPRPGQVYPSYFDPYGHQPYAYFSGKNDPLDCHSLGLKPYQPAAAVVYQIISAGPDGRFGAAGDVWSPTNAAATYPAGTDGTDDWANFHAAPLGQRQ